MAVMAREKWTDERLDDLNLRMEKGFDEVKDEVREMRREMNARFDSMERRFTSHDARFDALQRTMVLGVVSMSATVVGALLVIQL
ncbi:MAG TPA: hypothetical protein VFU16_12740 [Solirubrobacterales bacterium]|nr:hypothetical protein [Solirubrobacterales bacterium]